jgi:arginyl-tRNA--protein-N-Asp/Glu arginylyltransferase
MLCKDIATARFAIGEYNPKRADKRVLARAKPGLT